MSVEVQPVGSRRDRKEFVELPYRLHSNSGVWVPPLRLERRLFLNRRLNPFFSRGDAQLFLAWRDSRVVGRISAHYDDAFNAHHGNRWGMFGFIELEDDPEILPALLSAAEEWLRSRGRDHMVGPMDFTMNDESGVMVAETQEGETAAVAITVPDVNQVLAKMNGRLLPLGWWRYLRKGKVIDRV